MSERSTDDEPEPDDSGTSNKLEQKGRTITDANSGFEVGSVLDLGSAGNVGVREGISYGLGLIVYIVGLLLITSVLSGVGIAFLLAANGVNSGIITALIGLFGFIIFLTSLVVFLSGIAGLQYKIIADGVSRGTNTE